MTLLSRRQWQFAMLYGSMIASLVLGVFTSSFNAAHLGATGFGRLKLALTLVTFATALLQCGFFVSTGRLVALENSPVTEKDLVAGVSLLALLQGLTMMALAASLSGPMDRAFRTPVSHLIWSWLPLLLAFPLRSAVESVLQGTNRIGELALLRSAPSAGYLAIAYVLALWQSFSESAAYAINLGSVLVVTTAIVVRSKPRSSLVREALGLIWAENRRFGLHVHVGYIASVAIAQSNVLLVAFFMSPDAVGVFALAQAMTAPLLLVPSTVATSYFREFANAREIDTRVLRNTAIVSAVSLVAFALLAPPFIRTFFSSDFRRALGVAHIMALGSIMHGFGDLYNRFLFAHGQGKMLRNSAFIVAAASVGSAVAFVPLLGLDGAGFGVVLVGGSYLAMMRGFYRRYVNSLQTAAEMK